MNKKILIVTERRADYSRFKEILKEINLKKNLKYILVATGIHLENDYGKTINGDFEPDYLYNVIILDNYVPDSPGWCGDIALVVHGVSCCKDILYRIEDKWTWVESMNEGEYNHNKELI